MNIIDCPFCGLEGISDEVTSCPACSGLIKRYMQANKMVSKRPDKPIPNIDKINKEREKLHEELEQKLDEILDLPEPKKPLFIRFLFTGINKKYNLIVLSILLVLAFLTFVCKLIIFGVIFSFAIVLGVPFWLYINHFDYDSEKEFYKKNTQDIDWETYKKQKYDSTIKDYNKMAYNLAMFGKREGLVRTATGVLQSEDRRIKCVNCKSHYIIISPSEKTATNKYGETIYANAYKCIECDHEWEMFGFPK